LAVATVVIPARYGSTRFPAKILASETGRPLVQHVVDQVRKCRRVRDVVVATDDERIVAALQPFGPGAS
jgi:3-deoxy-manno-octulosonate cytidylyltransferase (CMP-KDO synthetase)